MRVGDGTNARGRIVSRPWLIRSDFLTNFLREKVGKNIDKSGCVITI